MIEKTQKSAIRQRGATVVLAGKPNAGKSSLLNRLSGENSAIVTDTPGTTRDIVRESIEINGVPLIITDTAGLRDTLDPIESEGVRRARQEISHADLVLYLHDDTQGDICEPPLSDNPMLGILTKTDLSGRIAGEVSTDRRNMEWIGISSATGAGIDELRGQIRRQSDGEYTL